MSLAKNTLSACYWAGPPLDPRSMSASTHMSVSDLAVHVPLYLLCVLPRVHTSAITRWFKRYITEPRNSVHSHVYYGPEFFFSHGSIAFSVPRTPHYRGFTITHKPHSVETLWTSDQPGAQTSTLQQTTLTRDRHPRPRRDSKTRHPRKRAAAGLWTRYSDVFLLNFCHKSL